MAQASAIRRQIRARFRRWVQMVLNSGGVTDLVSAAHYCRSVGYIIEPASESWLVAFVNEYATAAWAAKGSVDSYVPVADLGAGPPVADTLSFRELAEVADRVYLTVLSDTAEGRAAALNELMRPAAPQVNVVMLDEPTSVVLSESENRGDLLALACGLTMIELIEEVGVARMGTCEATKCDRIYVDRSPQGNRSYCSQKCQTRIRVARYRARKQLEAESGNEAQAA